MDDWLQQYLDYINTSGDFSATEINPYLTGIEDGWAGYDVYDYQGISPEIMQALGNIFTGDAPGGMVDFPGGDESGSGWTGTPMDWMNITNIFDSESIAASLSDIGNMTGEPIRPGEVKALTPEMLEKTESAYYNPYETAGREELVEKLGKARGGVSTGGFAGSGIRTAGLSGAEKVYRGGYEKILGDIMKMRAGATEDVLDTIYGWQELIDQT